jgi:hypothetical protein
MDEQMRGRGGCMLRGEIYQPLRQPDIVEGHDVNAMDDPARTGDARRYPADDTRLALMGMDDIRGLSFEKFPDLPHRAIVVDGIDRNNKRG